MSRAIVNQRFLMLRFTIELPKTLFNSKYNVAISIKEQNINNVTATETYLC